jgi:hypothetical protein
MTNEIITNRAFCKLCRVEVESKSVHDFRSCKCGNLSVDGGREYLRRCFRDESTVVDTSIVMEETPIWKNEGNVQMQPEDISSCGV